MDRFRLEEVICCLQLGSKSICNGYKVALEIISVYRREQLFQTPFCHAGYKALTRIQGLFFILSVKKKNNRSYFSGP